MKEEETDRAYNVGRSPRALGRRELSLVRSRLDRRASRRSLSPFWVIHHALPSLPLISSAPPGASTRDPSGAHRLPCNIRNPRIVVPLSVISVRVSVG